MNAELKELKTGKNYSHISVRIDTNMKKDVKELMFRASLLYPKMSCNSLNQNLRKTFLSEAITPYKRSAIIYAQEQIETIMNELFITIGLEEELEIRDTNHKFK